VALPQPASALAGTSTYSQPAGIHLGDERISVFSADTPAFEPGGGAASVYPSTLSVPHAMRIVDVDVVIYGLKHANPDDVQLLLVQDGGPQVTLMANAGGAADTDPVFGVQLTFDDQATLPLPDDGPLTDGVFRPAAYGTPTQLPAPAPPVSGNTSLAAFNGLPTGSTWSLFAFDDDGSDFTGSISGWELVIAYETVPYPSTLAVSGAGVVQDVDVTLHGFTTAFAGDAELMLVGPSGQQATLMSDAGGSAKATDIQLRFDDEAGGDVPDPPGSDPLLPGTYRPTNVDDGHDPDSYPPPAPATTGATSLAAFDGTDPNGTWRLFAVDDEGADLTSIDSWSLEIDWDDSAAPTGTVSVAGGAAATKSAAVTLNLAATDPAPATGVKEMRFSNDGKTYSAFQPYAATAAWTLGKGDGAKTVFAQFRDVAGNVSTAASDTIVLDTTSPAAKRFKPLRNAQDVRPKAKVRIVATEALDPTTVTKGSVVLKRNGAKVRGKVSYVAARHKIVLKPKKELKPGTYKVIVKTRITDVVGNRFDAKKKPGLQKLTWRFEVG
jgi:subtilisin-like proprotein convertase family protein